MLCSSMTWHQLSRQAAGAYANSQLLRGLPGAVTLHSNHRGLGTICIHTEQHLPGTWHQQELHSRQAAGAYEGSRNALQAQQPSPWARASWAGPCRRPSRLLAPPGPAAQT